VESRGHSGDRPFGGKSIMKALGDCGTAKCLPVLRRGTIGRNLRVRDAIKEAIRHAFRTPASGGLVATGAIGH
jgi:hypothetical protein